MSVSKEFDKEKADAFLGALAATGRIMHACDAAGLAYDTMRNWRARDRAFADRVENAQRRHNELIEQEIDRRGREGVQRQVGWYKGEPGGEETVYSDVLLLARAKSRIPEYREKLVDVEVQTGGVLVVNNASASPKDWAEKHGGADE